MTYADEFVHSYERKLFEENRKKWKTDKKYADEKYIFVFHELPAEFEMCVYENVTAKGLQNKTNLPVVTVQDWQSKKSIAELDESFYFEHLELKCDESLLDEMVEKVAHECLDDRDKILNLEYREIKCGDFIYDHVMRTQVGGTFKWDEIDKRKYIEAIRVAFKSIDAAFILFEKYKPEYFITMEFLMAKGVIAKVAQRLGAKLLLINSCFPGLYILLHTTREIGMNFRICDELRIFVENTTVDKQIEEDLFVIHNPIEDRSWVKENGNKNVFIMLHALGDVPRIGSYSNVYADYAEWYEDTLRQIVKLKDVNWYIKDHPAAAWYGQQEFTKAVYEKYKSDHIFWCDKDISGMQIKEVADCVITVAGDVGIEYWAYGVPTVTLAKSYYSDWGISYNINSKETYYELLRNISKIEKPTLMQSNYAKKMINTYKSLGKNMDLFSRLFSDTREKQTLAYRSCDVLNYDIHYAFVQKYNEILREYDLTQSACYNLENVYEVY